MICVAACFLVCVSVTPTGAPPREVEPGEFSQSYLRPPELRFSDAGSGHPVEDELVKKLTDVEADKDERLTAARALWKGRSRRHATDVLQFLAEPPPGGEPFRAFQREVAKSLQPEAILRELRDGDYLWGTWLAFLRPHEDLVPVLLASIKGKPKMLPETILALGNSGDQRALNPLLELLGSKDYQTSGNAAQALGYLGDPKSEPALIKALANDNPWRQVKACGALAKLGTHQALPALEKLAKDDSYTGALAVKRMAEVAVEKIKKARAQRSSNRTVHASRAG